MLAKAPEKTASPSRTMYEEMYEGRKCKPVLNVEQILGPLLIESRPACVQECIHRLSALPWLSGCVDDLRSGKSVLVMGTGQSGKTALAELLGRAAYADKKVAVVEGPPEIGRQPLPPGWKGFTWPISVRDYWTEYLKQVKAFGPERVIVNEIVLGSGQEFFTYLLSIPGVFTLPLDMVGRAEGTWNMLQQSLKEPGTLTNISLVVELMRMGLPGERRFAEALYQVSSINLRIVLLSQEL